LTSKAVIGELQRVYAAESGLAQAETRPTQFTSTSHQLARVRAQAGEHAAALAELAGARGVELELSGGEEASAPRENDGRIVEWLLATTVRASAMYATLYATARFAFEGDVCDVADRHAADWVTAFHDLRDSLPAAVIGTLVEGGEHCRCVCPACGIGACLCMPNSVYTTRLHWGEHVRWGERAGDLPVGIELRVPPRPGSQLASAGLRPGDRILAVDGEAVSTLGDLQEALQRRPLNEPAPMTVLRRGSGDEISVARVSDLP
jgi:membrane-associated protease RseP (regulator of RpoE activity)